MTERENYELCVSNLEQQIGWIEDIKAHQFPGWGHTVNAMRQAIALLKAREPVEPIQGRDDQDEDIFCCGACGAVVGETFIGPPGECEVRDNYCPECGRAVKWE